MNDITLDSEAGIFDPKHLFSDRAIWTYALVGLVIVIVMMSTVMRDDSGFLQNPWSGGRILTTLVTILYGVGLGWVLYPRRVPAFWDDEV